MAKSLSDLFPDLDEREIAKRVDEAMKENKRKEELGQQAIEGCLWIIVMSFLGTVVSFACYGTAQSAAAGFTAGFVGTWAIHALRNIYRRYRKGTL